MSDYMPPSLLQDVIDEQRKEIERLRADAELLRDRIQEITKSRRKEIERLRAENKSLHDKVTKLELAIDARDWQITELLENGS